MFKKLIGAVLLLVTMNSYANSDMVTQIMTAFMQKNNIPGAVVELYVDGKPQTYYFGYANKAKKTPMTKNTIFEVASITKIMTSILLAQQFDAAKVQMDDSVTNYLPNLPNKFEDITLVNLATHTSGLPFESADDNLSKWTPIYAVDEEWVYSNVGMGLLGEALQKITHKKLDQLYHNNILSPLKMTSSGLTISNQNKKYFAQGYDKEGKPAEPLALGKFPAGYGMKISAADMQRFLSAVIGLPGTPERLFYQMRMTQSSYVKLTDRKQGLGWEIHSLKPNKIQALLHEPAEMNLSPIAVKEIYDKPKFNGDALIDKTGSSKGFQTYIAVMPNKQSGIVILTNGAVSHGEIVSTAREILFKMTKILPNDV